MVSLTVGGEAQSSVVTIDGERIEAAAGEDGDMNGGGGSGYSGAELVTEVIEFHGTERLTINQTRMLSSTLFPAS